MPPTHFKPPRWYNSVVNPLASNRIQSPRTNGTICHCWSRPELLLLLLPPVLPLLLLLLLLFLLLYFHFYSDSANRIAMSSNFEWIIRSYRHESFMYPFGYPCVSYILCWIWIIHLNQTKPGDRLRQNWRTGSVMCDNGLINWLSSWIGGVQFQ